MQEMALRKWITENVPPESLWLLKSRGHKALIETGEVVLTAQEPYVRVAQCCLPTLSRMGAVMDHNPQPRIHLQLIQALGGNLKRLPCRQFVSLASRELLLPLAIQDLPPC